MTADPGSAPRGGWSAALGRAARRAVEERRVPPYVRRWLRERLWLLRYRTHHRAARGLGRRRSGVDAAVSMREIAERNAAAVSTALAAAGVEHLVVDRRPPGGLTLAVPSECKSDARAALRRFAPELTVEPASERRATGVGTGAWAPGGRRWGRHLDGALAWLAHRPHVLAPEHVVGSSHACRLEFWPEVDGERRSPDRTGARVPPDSPRTTVRVADRDLDAWAELVEGAGFDEPSFPIDVVYTWVDDRDPGWRQAYEEALAAHGADRLHAQAANASRYRDRDELRYSLRSVALHADFVRRIHVVTAGQSPAWLDLDHPKVHLVDHSEILPEEGLPTFNSHAIESRLHHIDGLAEHYLYLNDDFFFGREVPPSLFFLANGLWRFFPDPRAPIPASAPSRDDRPVDVAAKNGRDLMQRDFSHRAEQKMQHLPYAQRRSVLDEMEERYPEYFERTARSRFRSPADVSVASFLSHHYAFATGRAVPGEIHAEYANIAGRWIDTTMARMLSTRSSDAFCLNETELDAQREEQVHGAIASFLEAYFPAPSPYEVD